MRSRPASPAVLFLTAAFACLACACDGTSPAPAVPTAEPTAPQAAAPEAAPEAVVAELRFDETVAIDGLRLRLLELQDSRCPKGVQCVWEGQVVVTLEAGRDGAEPEAAELTLRAGVESPAVEAAGHQLRLLEVAPYPRDGVATARGEHVVTIEIRPVVDR